MRHPAPTDSAPGRVDAAVDVLVVGGGPAGLTAALVLARARRTVLVVDDEQPRNRSAGHMHGYLGLDGVPPAELLRRGRLEAAAVGAEIRAGRVVALDPHPSGAGLDATLGDGSTVRARRVLVATGLRDELPKIDGLSERWGRDVLHCPYCDGWEHRDSTIVVVVTSVEEVDKAFVFRQLSADVGVALHGVNRDDLPEIMLTRLDSLGIDLHAGPVTEVIVEQDQVRGLRIADGAVLPCEVVAVQPRVVANDDLLVSLGVDVSADRFGEAVVADDDGATGIGGVMAAGNVSDPQAQVVTAAAAGHRAAVVLDHELVLEDVDAAVAEAAAHAGRAAARDAAGT